MKNILVLGAGLSSTSLIAYLLDHSTTLNWKVKVGDLSLEAAKEKIKNHPNGSAFQFDLSDSKQLAKEIANVDVVISMLPAFMHPVVAKECVNQGKHMGK